MGAWSDLSLTQATLMGIAPVDLINPDTATYDSTRLTANYENAAKREVEAHIVKAMPRLVALTDGPETFLDDAADVTNISNLLQDVLAYAFLKLYYAQERYSDTDLYDAKHKEAKESFVTRVQALTEYLLADEDFITALEGSSGEQVDKWEGVVWIG